MAIIHSLDIPNNLYVKLQELAVANDLSMEEQIIILIEQALENQIQYTEAQRRRNVLKLLEEIRSRRRVTPVDCECPNSDSTDTPTL